MRKKTIHRKSVFCECVFVYIYFVRCFFAIADAKTRRNIQIQIILRKHRFVFFFSFSSKFDSISCVKFDDFLYSMWWFYSRIHSINSLSTKVLKLPDGNNASDKHIYGHKKKTVLWICRFDCGGERWHATRNFATSINIWLSFCVFCFLSYVLQFF